MKEKDIRPNKLFNEYLRLAKEDCEKFFKKKARVDFNCPIHPDIKGKEKFSKNGFFYRQCSKCSSIYVSPRHSMKSFLEFYLCGKSENFGQRNFIKRQKILGKRNYGNQKLMS